MPESDAAVVNLFLTIRVLLVGGIFLALPRITRKGLVFGTYVGEAVAEGDEVRGLVRSWNRGCALVMALSLIVDYSISLAGWPLGGNFTGTGVLLVGALLLYLRLFQRARLLAPAEVTRQAEVSSASLSARPSNVDVLAKTTLGFCSVVGLATIAFAAISYGGMPDQMTTYAGFLKRTAELTEKTPVAVMYLPCLSMVVSVAYALLGVLVASAKRSTRAGVGSHSAAAQEVFHSVQVRFFSGTAIFFGLALTGLAIEYVRVAQGEISSLSDGLIGVLVLLLGLMLALIIWTLVRLLRCSGQGGALLEKGSVDRPLTGGLADNTHWVLGMFYINRDDPSMIVESRFVLGYALNWGNWRAALLMGVFLVLLIVSIILPCTGAIQ